MAHVDLLFNVKEVNIHEFIHFKSNNLKTEWCRITIFSIWIYPKMILKIFGNGLCWSTFQGHRGKKCMILYTLRAITCRKIDVVYPNLVHGCILRWSEICLKMTHVDLLFQVTEVKMYEFIHFKSNNMKTIWRRITIFNIWMHPKMILKIVGNGLCWPTL